MHSNGYADIFLMRFQTNRGRPLCPFIYFFLFWSELSYAKQIHNLQIKQNLAFKHF